MKQVCAWCGKALGSDEAYASDGDISHGICSQCAIKLSGFEPRTAKEVLDYVQEPVFVFNPDGVVTGANHSGLEMLGKNMEEIENALGGDAFECSYADEEGGCGNTLHCKTCSIRNTVMDTLATGKGYKNVPAFQSIKTEAGIKILKFYISTEKVGESILLRIDSVSDTGKN
ncbi:MAG: hypothetical protein SWC96_06000 [Thermodesulfobacteriota bacterium]|nr:hypothetical protein [Thermodesulfobacteriota bacterium]